jgi:hypothetical protein
MRFCQMLEGVSIDRQDRRESGPGDPVEVRRIKFSECFEIVDGHHRLALAFVRGMKRQRCAILPTEEALTPMQQMVMDSVGLAGKMQLSQPIAAPELRTWQVKGRCADQLGMMLRKLSELKILSGSFLDIGSSYGWLVSEMSKRSFQAFGVEQSAPAAAVGPVAYGLPSSTIIRKEATAFLSSAKLSYDIVSCFGMLGKSLKGNGPITAEAFIKLLDKVTRSVLFLGVDDPESVQRDRTTQISEWIKDNTGFESVERLGAYDRPEMDQSKEGYSMLACIRDRDKLGLVY